ncbi:MAG TPA: phage major capsid protein [Anaerolineaceae bacterium]|nr:phage major capsid protein [Anaerolineaceae bacterium]
MSELYRIKIQVPDTVIEREIETEKRLKENGEYTDPGWRVLGIPYGGPVNGRDLDGEAFTDATDIWLQPGDQINITYYHGFDPDKAGKKQDVPALIGRATYTGADERGHWFEPVLDASEPLAQRLMKASIDNLRASSGAINHLVRKETGGLISVWPVGELALFDTNEWRRPANDFAVIEAKAEDIAEAIPEAEESAVDAVEESVEADITKLISIIPEEDIMDEEKLVEEVKAEEPEVDIKAELESVKKSIIEELKAAPGEVKGVPTVKAPKESPSFAKALLAWAKGDNPRGFKGNDIELKGAWEGGEDTEGGYLVPDDFYNRIVEQRQELSFIRKAPVTRLTTTRDRILIPTEATAGTKLVVTAEEGAYDENEPVFGQVALTIHKFTKMIKISEELVDDEGAGLDAYIASVIARASAAAENYYCAIGAGGGEPQGIVNGATASGITTAAANAITAAELIQMMGTVESPYHNTNSGWLMKGATKFYLQGLSGSPFVFIPTPAGGDFMGYPAYIAPDMDGLTTSAKSVIFGDFSMYAFAEREGVTLSRNPYLYQANGQIGLFVKQRFGGAVLQTLAFKYLAQHS